MNKYFSSLIIGLTVIISAAIFSGAWKRTHQSGQSIKVTGLAKQDFESDLIVWTGNFSQKSMNMKEAYSRLNKDAEMLKSYLLKKGVKQEEMIFSAVSISKEFETVRDSKFDTEKQVFNGYNLAQDVKIESKEVDKIEKISREITELIDIGIEFYSYPPSYYSTKLAELKISMLAAAAKDGRQRAATIAENSGSKLGRLMNANMGIFQITGRNSSEDFTYGGSFNISSKLKTASITVRLEFAIK
jgi:uncharacterized protein